MTDADFLTPRQNQCILTTHTEVLSRADRGTGIINGNKIVPTDPASLVLTIYEGRIRTAFALQDVVEDTVTIDEGHATLPRIDIIYRDGAGESQVMKGTPAVIEDPKNLSDWKSYTSPMPPTDIPAGAIIGAVWIPAECAAIQASYIWMFAGGVSDIATS